MDEQTNNLYVLKTEPNDQVHAIFERLNGLLNQYSDLDESNEELHQCVLRFYESMLWWNEYANKTNKI